STQWGKPAARPSAWHPSAWIRLSVLWIRRKAQPKASSSLSPILGFLTLLDALLTPSLQLYARPPPGWKSTQTRSGLSSGSSACSWRASPQWSVSSLLQRQRSLGLALLWLSSLHRLGW